MARMERYDGPLRDPSEVSGIYRARVEDNNDPLKLGRVRIRVPLLHGFEGNGVSKRNLPWASYCAASGGYGYGSMIVPEVGEYVFVLFEDNSVSKPVYLGSVFGTGATSAKAYGSESNQGVWYGVPGDSEVPKDILDSYPNKKAVYKSPKGSSILVDDSNEKESISIIDPIGQVIKMESSITKGVSHRRDCGDIESTSDYVNSSKESRITITAAGKQKLELSSNGDDIKVYLGDGEGKNCITILPCDNGISIIAGDNVSVKAPKITLDGDVTIIE